jgi:hypothetical protein
MGKWGGNKTGEGVVLLTVSPADMSTSTGATNPTVAVHAPAKLGEGFKVLSPALHLVTWPEGTDVPVDLVLSESADGKSPATVDLIPKAPLSDRWYAVRVDSPPAGFGLPQYGALKRNADGSVLSRFRPGVSPTVAWVETCSKGGTVTGAVVMSERVNGGADPSALLSFDRADCRYRPQPTSGVPDKDADYSVGSLNFVCDKPGDVTVRLAAGATAAADAKRSVGAGTYVLNSAKLEPMGESCSRLVVDP